MASLHAVLSEKVYQIGLRKVITYNESKILFDLKILNSTKLGEFFANVLMVNVSETTYVDLV